MIDEHRHAAVLTYRESKSLHFEGRERIKRLEVETSEPLRAVVRDGVARGVLSADDPDLVAYNLLLAHAWALKHWYFEQSRTLDSYIQDQLALALRAILATDRTDEYSDLLSHEG